MTQQQIIDAGIDYTMQRQPVCIGALVSKDSIRQMHRNPSFEAGAEWAKENLMEEVCEWLDYNLFEVITGINGISVMSYEDISLKEFIENFKKAIDE